MVALVHCKPDGDHHHSETHGHQEHHTESAGQVTASHPELQNEQLASTPPTSSNLSTTRDKRQNNDFPNLVKIKILMKTACGLIYPTASHPERQNEQLASNPPTWNLSTARDTQQLNEFLNFLKIKILLKTACGLI